jgi:hypothetical protein
MSDTKELVTSPHTLHSTLALTYSTLRAKSNYSVSLISLLEGRGQHVCAHGMRVHTHTKFLKGENFLQRKCKIRSIFFINFCILISSKYFILFQLQNTQIYIIRATCKYSGNTRALFYFNAIENLIKRVS